MPTAEQGGSGGPSPAFGTLSRSRERGAFV